MQFFLRGTLLDQLSIEYATAKASGQLAADAIKEIKEDQGSLVQKLHEVAKKIKEHKNLQELELIVQDMRALLAWSRVKDKEQQQSKLATDLEMCQEDFEGQDANRFEVFFFFFVFLFFQFHFSFADLFFFDSIILQQLESEFKQAMGDIKAKMSDYDVPISQGHELTKHVRETISRPPKLKRKRFWFAPFSLSFFLPFSFPF